MKKGVRIINCARGGIISEEDLCNAIKSGQVAGAAIDVFDVEPPVGNKLLELEQVIITPHLGASTEEAQFAVAVEAAEQMADALTGKGFRNAVNLSPYNQEEYNILKPYIILAEKMGSLLMQITKGGLQNVDIIYTGKSPGRILASLPIVLWSDYSNLPLKKALIWLARLILWQNEVSKLMSPPPQVLAILRASLLPK